MVNEQFANWVKEIGITKAADLVSTEEAKRGNKAVTYQVMQDWMRNGIPPRRVLSVAAASGISAFDLDPEMYPASLRTSASA